MAALSLSSRGDKVRDAQSLIKVLGYYRGRLDTSSDPKRRRQSGPSSRSTTYPQRWGFETGIDAGSVGACTYRMPERFTDSGAAEKTSARSVDADIRTCIRQLGGAPNLMLQLKDVHQETRGLEYHG